MEQNELSRCIPLLGVFNQDRIHPIVVMPQYISTGTVPPTGYGSYCFTYALQLVDAVAFLHLNLICHLDIKSDNVVVDEGLHKLYLIDFGLAIRVESLEEKIYGARGTPDEVAPELDLSSSYPEHGFPLDASEVVWDPSIVFNPFLVDTWAVGYVICHFVSIWITQDTRPLYNLSEELRAKNPSDRLPLREASRRLHMMNSSKEIDWDNLPTSTAMNFQWSD